MRPKGMNTETTKEMRQDIEQLVSIINNSTISGTETTSLNRELLIVKTKLQEARMWLGKHLGTLPGNVDLNAKRDAEEV